MIEMVRSHTLHAEDLNHGQDYKGVRVVNPFLVGQ